MHSAVLQNKKYIKFASKNTVEVMSLSRLKEGIEKQDPRAATYKAKDAAGNEGEFLVKFPGLTVEDVEAVRRSKASSYNDTGRIPHTAFVDPFTLEKLNGIRGGTSAKNVMELAEEARKAIQKAQGKPTMTRKDIALIRSTGNRVKAAIGKGDFGKAMKAVRKIGAKAKGWPELARKQVDEISKIAIDHMARRLDGLQELAAQKPGEARKKLTGILIRVRGTELEERVSRMLKELGESQG